MLDNLPTEIIGGVPMSMFIGVGGARIYCVNTMKEWRAFFSLLMQQSLVACDTETSGFRYYDSDRVCGLSFGWRDIHFYIPVRHLESLQEGPPPPQLDMKDIREDLIAFFSKTDVFTIWHNFRFDSHFYLADGINIKTPFHDTMFLWTLYNENSPAALKSIVAGWTDPNMGIRHKGLIGPKANEKEKEVSRWREAESRLRRKTFNRLVMDRADQVQKDPKFQSMNRREIKKYIANTELYDHEYKDCKKSDIHYGYVPVSLMCEYAGLDTFFTWKVYDYVMSNLPMNSQLQDLYINELKLSKYIQQTEETGVKIDRDYLESLVVEFDGLISEYTQPIKEVLGDINLNSNQQLAKAFLDQGVKLKKKTKSAKKCQDCANNNCIKHFAVDEEVLSELSKKYDIVNTLVELKNIKKLKSTYAESILDKITEDDVLHCSFNQNVSTGRMSCKDPNLQNIPGKDKSIRKAFISPGGDWIFLFFDYSQVEVRLTAGYSQDPLLIDSYKNKQDVHTRTMCEMFKLDYDRVYQVLKVDEDKSHPNFDEWDFLRSVGKVLNFSIIYGSGAPGLSRQIPRPKEYKNATERRWISVCQDYIDNYLDKYRGVRKFINQRSREIRKNGYVTNAFGRVRHLPHVRARRIKGDSTLGWLEGKAQRQGVNFLIQASAADLFKIAVVRVGDLLKDYQSHMVNFVHDEIQIYLHKDEIDLVPQIKNRMEDFPQFSVPLVVDVEYSTTNWADKKSL